MQNNEKGSKTAKDGFLNEKLVVEKFNSSKRLQLPNASLSIV